MNTARRLLLLARPYGDVPLTLSGNEITDASRTLGVQGDGLLNDSSFGIWKASTNLCTNGGFETNTTGWTTGGTNTLSASASRAKFGTKGGLATYQDNALLADCGVTITNVAHTASAWVYIPTAYDGGGIELRQTGFTVAASAIAAAMGTRDAWQRLSLTFTPGADVTGSIQINNTGAAPTAGRDISIDGVQLEATYVATPYIETDGATATRSAARVQAPASLLDETQGWVAMRVRPGWSAAAEMGGGTAYPHLFYWADDANNAIDFIYVETTNALGGARKAGGVGAGYYAVRTLTQGVPFTVIAAWTATTTVGHAFDGGAFSTAANTSIPTLSAATFDIFNKAGTLQFNGDVIWFACGTGTLTNADSALLYSWGNADPQWSWFPASAQLTGLWDGRSRTMQIRSGL